jgi:hypothetical protein
MKGTLHEDQYTFFITSRSVLHRMRNVLDKSFREKQTTHWCSMIFSFSKNLAFYEIAGKYCRAGKAADENVAHAHCMLDT